MTFTYDNAEFYRAHLARDPRFDGKFFVAVKTTQIYCRPTCPARKAQLKNLEFFIHAVQAEAAGYRPCMRCRPETAPGSAAWMGTSATVQRAIRIMDCFALEELPMSALAERLGVGERWLRELFQQQVGTNPQSILLSKKLDLARNLLDQSSLSITEIAFSSGFQSIRRFNDAFKSRFHKTPSEVRKTPQSESKGQLRFQLSYRPPYAWNQMLRFFANRAIAGVEWVEQDCYQRLITLGDIRGWVKVTHGEKHKIDVEVKLNKSANTLEFVARLKNMFDLDCDPMAIEAGLQQDPKLQPWLAQHPGLRIPGGWDGFELAVRAVVGQKISVKAARTVLGRIVEVCGERQTLDPLLPLQRFSPTPEQLFAADLSSIGLTNAKIETLKALARQVADKNLLLDGTADFEDTCRKLLLIKGIGAWTVEYIAMRALRNPNAFPATDLELKKQMLRLQLDSTIWNPWRAYAAILLWNLPMEDQ